jgi:hypothetical protein
MKWFVPFSNWSIAESRVASVHQRVRGHHHHAHTRFQCQCQISNCPSTMGRLHQNFTIGSSSRYIAWKKQGLEKGTISCWNSIHTLLKFQSKASWQEE